MEIYSNPKIPLIITDALEILIEKGDSGLTMRQVAARVGISLSNVQFYFKTKDDLLKGIVDYYFGQCLELLTEHTSRTENLPPEEKVRQLMDFLLNSSCDRKINMALREFWAISSRNDEIKAYLHDYYRKYMEKLSAVFSEVAVRPENSKKAASLIVPYMEGYANLSGIQPVPAKESAGMLMELVFSILLSEEG